MSDVNLGEKSTVSALSVQKMLAGSRRGWSAILPSGWCGTGMIATRPLEVRKTFDP
jgi:hypothetical protein